MKKQFLPLMLLASAICSCSEKQPETTEPMITKTEIQVENGHFTPEIMHRLGKVAWLLQYNNEEHNLVERRNCKDLSIRLSQFFDHYLKGAPMPEWMKNGRPATKKGFDLCY